MVNLQKSVKRLPDRPGVYLFKGHVGQVLYVGKSINVRERVKSHLTAVGSKSQSLIVSAVSVESILVNYELEALLVEAELIKKYQPRYNSTAKDDKHPLYIKISKEEFPKIITCRREDESDAKYFGPFPSSSTVRQVLRQIRKIFPYCAQKKIGRKPCFYSHLGLCRPCPAEIRKVTDIDIDKGREMKTQYKGNIRKIVLLLKGKNKTLKKKLEKEMKEVAGRQDFEKAAVIRDQLAQLSYITTPYKEAGAYLENPNLLSDLRADEIQSLQKLLKLQRPPHRIECFDVAHLGGVSTTASMVTFINGEPEKNLYRRFKVRTVKKSDDVVSMAETIKRRLKHFDDWGKPDLVLVDGGKPQVSATKEVLGNMGVKTPVIGLAKRLEEIIVPTDGGFRILRLPTGSPALTLLQRLRDEAHRFARSYHFKLRLRELRR